ncbi:MAG: hypothetical protein LBG91_02235 [Treponema sp.]|jgi:hypothetical protein|nr:hypothetical protein [Treponema sp.]
MINRRPYTAESAVKPGCAVVQGSADNKVKAPANDGYGDFIGLYAFEANEEKKAGEAVGIVLYGAAKALAGGTVAAGKKAILKPDASGTLVVLPATAGGYKTVGTFLESGSAGDYVDVLIERGNVSI